MARPLAAAPKLTASDFQIDLFQGPILGSSRVVGLGGAFTAVAEESVGLPFNPASVGHRTYYSADRFDWDVGFDFLIPGLFQADDFDFDNNGRQASADAIALLFGGQIQYRSWGIGVYARGQSFEVTESTGTDPRTYRFWLWLTQLATAYAFLDHQLIVGVGLRYGILQAFQGQREDLFRLQTIGGEVGAVYCPLRWPFRLGLAFSSPMKKDTPKECTEEQCPTGFVMPTAVALPWEVRVGAAYYIGAKPFNRLPDFMLEKPTDAIKPPLPPGSQPATSQPATSQPATSQPAEKKKPKRKPDPDRDYRGGRYVMISVELDIVGNVDDAIGLDGFIDQVREPSGEKISFSPHLGVESEVWRRRLRLRAGAYYEPTRFSESSGRFHGTFSFDLRLFDFSLWGQHSVRAGAAIDFASRYSNVAFTLGFWHGGVEARL